MGRKFWFEKRERKEENAKDGYDVRQKTQQKKQGADQTGVGDIETKNWERSVRNGAR